MKKILVLVEGQTEEGFVKQLLAPLLPSSLIIPSIVKTKNTGAQPKKGGTVTYHEFRKQLNLLLGDSSAGLVTMMIDYQGLGDDFPGRNSIQGTTALARVQYLEGALKADVGNIRFLPFFMLHEFEAMLFVQPYALAFVVQERRLIPGLNAVRSRYSATPEDINDSPATSPSARIEKLCEDIIGSKDAFSKRAHGPLIAGRIGIDNIRVQCPHFDQWLSALESFAAH